jgi:hypothetical protein
MMTKRWPSGSFDRAVGQTLTFNWTFTRRDLHALLAKIAAKWWLPQPDGIRHRNSERE